MYSKFGLFINGQWTGSSDGRTLSVIDPSNEETIGHIPYASQWDLDRVLHALAGAAPLWRATSGWERSATLRRIANEMRQLAPEMANQMSFETGKPLAEAAGEVNAAIEQFDWYSDEARRIFGHSLDGRDANVRLQVRYDPVGPVAAFSAWNFPALLPARKIAAALAAGCPIVIKPAEESPSSTYFMAQAAQAAGLPDGVLNVVTGSPQDISAYLIASPVIRKVSLTGSVPVGKAIMQLCAQEMKKVSLELGGHAPVLVFGDADPVAAGVACARAKFRNAGQVCISPSRFFVHESIYTPFSQAMAQAAAAIRVGRGLDAGVECGPMANARGRDRIQNLVNDAVHKGAELLCGGRIPDGMDRGYYFAPTVLGHVPAHANLLLQEPFGPVAPIMAFSEFDEVVQRANAVPFGLAGYVFSNSLQIATRAAEALEVGMVGVNDMMLAAAEAPFGGIKESGMGREGGRLGIFDYLEPKYMKFRLA